MAKRVKLDGTIIDVNVDDVHEAPSGTAWWEDEFSKLYKKNINVGTIAVELFKRFKKENDIDDQGGRIERELAKIDLEDEIFIAFGAEWNNIVFKKNLKTDPHDYDF